MTRAKKPKPKNRPGPFHSKLLPYAADIKKWRRAGDTWAQVVAKLAKHNCTTDAGSVCRFIKRYEKKPYGIGQAPEPGDQSPSVVVPGRPDIHSQKKQSKPLNPFSVEEPDEEIFGINKPKGT